jgi:hypothetical protein
MPSRNSLITDFREQNLRLLDVIADSLIPSYVNIEDDKVRRITNDGDDRISGYLEIDNISGRHLALKAMDGTYYTISATGNGLEIGVLNKEKGESTPIATINGDKGLVLEGDFLDKFAAMVVDALPMEDLTTRVIKQLNKEGAPLQIGRKLQLKDGMENQGVEPKGIFSSGFKGFKEGLVPADGKTHKIHDIPKDSHGAYKIRAWLVKDRNKNHVSLESTVYFFPDKTVKPYDSTLMENILENTPKQLSRKLPKEQKLKAHIIKSNKNSVSLKLLTEEVGDGKVLKLGSSPEANDKDNHSAEISFTIERLWEGAAWIDSSNKNQSAKSTDNNT